MRELGARSGASAQAGARALGACALLLVETVALDAVYDVRAVSAALSPLWLGANEAVKHSLYAGLYALGALALILWPRRDLIGALWAATRGRHPWRLCAAGNLALFALLFGAALAARSGGGIGWGGLGALALGALAMAAHGLAVAAPAGFWLALLRAEAPALMLAAGAGAAISAAALLAQSSWAALSGATLQLSHALLATFEPRALMDVDRRLLGIGDFQVTIDSYCSGYEGVGLVLGALGLYLFLFRARLRFPDVFVLLPLGAGLIWLLNGGRIAALVAIGAHVSPQLALTGFHSQAGWLLFVAVTAGLMWAAEHGFRREGAALRPAASLAAAMLFPFAALMAARIAAGVFAGDPWAGVVAMAAPAAALWLCRRTIAAFWRKLSIEATVAGLLVGALWIATEPGGGGGDALGLWLERQGPAEAGAWLALRVLGFVLIAPMAEELAFRGYLYRALARRRFEEADPGAFSWLALAVTSVVFGLLHERWMAGALAGAAYAFVLCRTRSLSAAVQAHIASNALIALFAAAAGAWTLL